MIVLGIRSLLLLLLVGEFLLPLVVLRILRLLPHSAEV